MSTPLTAAWDALYGAQTFAKGVRILATVTGFATNKSAILEEVNLDNILVYGGDAEAGGFGLQMKQSDFSAEPPKQTPVTCNGAAEGITLEVGGVINRDGIYYIRALDFAAGKE